MDGASHKHYWFKSHKYGLGWTPCSWQGWFILVLYIFILICSLVLYDKESNSVFNFLMNISPMVVISSLALMWIMYSKGEPPHWHLNVENRF